MQLSYEVAPGRRWAWRVLAVMLAAAVAGSIASCAGDTGSITNPNVTLAGGTVADARNSVATVTVTPGTAAGAIGDSAYFTATARNSNGRILTNYSVTWSSTDTTVVTINSVGLARAVGPGFVKIVAHMGGVSGTADGAVLPAPSAVAQVLVSPESAIVSVNDSGPLTATVIAVNGDTLTDRTVTWTTSNASAVTVTETGYVRAVGVGDATITAASEGVAGTSSISVLPPSTPPGVVTSVTVSPGAASGTVGDAAQFSAVAQDGNGDVVDHPVTWSSSNTAVVTVTATGWATAVGAGTANIIATVDGVEGSASATVFAPPPPPPPPAAVASVTVSPASSTIGALNTTLLVATLRDAQGNELTGRSIEWSSSNALVASVDGSGTVTGIVAGSVTISAVSEGQMGGASVTVTILPPPPPPSDDWPNAPSDYSLISDQSFDLLTSLGWGLVGNMALVSSVPDLGAPLSPSGVLQMKYPAGLAGGTSPGNEYRPLPGLRKFYSGLWWKVSSPWDGHDSGVNKIQFHYLSSGSDFAMVMYGPPGGPYDLRVGLQLRNADTRFWLTPNVNTQSVSLGQWHKIEWLVDFTIPSAGTIKWWMDGQLIGDYRDVVFPSSETLIEYQLAPTWGGMGDVKSTTDYFWFDHVFVKGS